MTAAMDTLVRSILVVIVAVIGARFTRLLFQKKTAPLPPGPRGLPLLGNIRDLPTHGEREWEHWLKLKDTYGPISSVTSLGQTIIVLHSPELALELLDRRSSKYSSRTCLAFADLIGWADTLAMRPYNKTHRLHRKLAHVMIGTQKTVEPYLNLQEKEAHRFLFRVLQQPEKLLDHIRTEAGAVILKIIYGYTVETHNLDPLVHLVDVTIENFGVSTLPGEWYVDIIPALKYVPGWMPGTRWKKTARKWRAILVETLEKPLEFARQQIAKGDKTKSFISEIHRGYGDKLSPEYEHALKWVAFSMYAAGADTTVSTISSFYLAMTLFPEVQRRAREEIDRVIGTGRLPAFGDRESLPYVDAVVKEAWRWHPVTPMGIAHRTTADDMINGYYIPKGATILTNIWWFTHDPAVYPNPSAFDPSRYLGPNPQPDPANHIFGYGRRICPGRYLGTSSVWLTISRSLAVFDIRKSLDESGREVEPHVGFSPGLVSRIEPFRATIKPRSAKHEALIRQLEEIHPWEKSNADEIGENVSLRD